MRFTILCLGCLGLVACDTKDEGDDTTTTTFTDADEDGFGPGADCDDSNAAIFPGADELCDGVDNNCDGLVDNEPADGIMGYEDADGDGYGDPDTAVLSCDIAGLVADGTDCDDASNLRNPGEEEVCDGIDNDCDGLVDGYDDDAVGTSTFYLDSDGDGFGGTTSVESCEAPLGHVDNSDDCDDTSAGVSPAWYEVVCDNIDNNCDGVVDANLVPRDYASIQDAVDALPDGSEICLDAGTHAESVDVSDRLLTVSGRGAMEDILLDVSGSAPFFLASSSGTGSGRLVVQNVTVVGEHTFSAPEQLPGSLAHVVDGSLSLRNVAVDGVGISSVGVPVEGGLVYAEDATVSATDMTISDFMIDLVDGSPASNDVVGGAFGILSGTLSLSNVTMDNPTVSISGDTSEGVLLGLLAYGYESTVTVEASRLSGAAVDASGPAFVGLGMGIGSEDSDLTMMDVEVSDNTFSLTGDAFAQAWGVVGSLSYFGGSAELTDLALNGNSIHVTGGEDSLAMGHLVSVGPSFSLDRATVYNNSTMADSPSDDPVGAAFGTVLVSGAGELSHLDVRGNSLNADGGGASGGGLLLDAAGGNTISLMNAIVAGNTIESASGEAFGAGIALTGKADSLAEVYNASIFGNHILNGTMVGGSGIYASYEDSAVTVTNTSIGGGTAMGDVVEGTAVHVELIGEGTAVPPTWTYNNVHDPLTDPPDAPEDNLFFGIEDPTNAEEGGNISKDPKYNDSTDADPTNWDFTYPATSGLRNAGDPEIFDANGSRSDIGAYGGPGSEGW